MSYCVIQLLTICIKFIPIIHYSLYYFAFVLEVIVIILTADINVCNRSFSLQVCSPAYLVRVPSQDKLGGLRQEGHPT